MSETVILNIDINMTKKCVDKKKYPQIVHVLKQSVGTITIIKQISDLGVSIEIGELSASRPAVKK